VSAADEAAFPSHPKNEGMSLRTFAGQAMMPNIAFVQNGARHRPMVELATWRTGGRRADRRAAKAVL
jgi:hypothetical protein